MTPSDRVRAIAGSATLTISARAGELRAAGQDVITLSVGQPDFPTPEHIVEAAREALSAGAFGYTPTAGTPTLREAVAQRTRAVTGQPVAPAQVLVSSGAKQSLHNLMQALVDPDDDVLVPVPYWVSYPPMVQLAQGRFVPLQTRLEDGFRLTVEQLREALTPRSRILLLNSPSNPTGAAYRRKELEALAEVVLSHPRLVILSDEIYHPLTYGGFQHVSPAALGPEVAARTFVVDGVSKAYAMTGWRIGYAVGDPAVIAAATRYQDHTTSCASAVSQAAAEAALTGSQQPVEQMRQAFEQRMEAMAARVATMEGLSLHRPEGAFYAFVKLGPALRERHPDDVALCQALIEEAHVATVPGSAFGAPGHIRLSFAVPTARIDEGLQRIEAFLSR
jgi:aspartate aminotransferase